VGGAEMKELYCLHVKGGKYSLGRWEIVWGSPGNPVEIGNKSNLNREIYKGGNGKKKKSEGS